MKLFGLGQGKRRKKMYRGAVESTFAKSIGYTHEHGGILEIETHPSRNAPGHIYRYTGITPMLFAKLVTAHSIGSYYNRFIKNKFPSIEIWESHMEALTVDLEISDHLANKLVTKMFQQISRGLTVNFNLEG